MNNFESPQIKEKEYLNPGVKAIMASLGEGKIQGMPEGLTQNDIDFVNINADPKEELEPGFIGEYIKPHWAYIMSPVDGAHKFSMQYAECTGVVTVGSDSITGENVSFLTHQNPSYFTLDSANFVRDLSARLEEIKLRCVPGTVDAILFGGKFTNVKEFADEPNHPIHQIEKKEYLDSIKIAAKEIENVLGFSPTVISGPKINPAYEQVVFDTIERRLFLERLGKEDADFVRDFDAKDVDMVTQGLKPGEWPLPEEIRKLIKKKD